jgi:DNA polymerase III delta prime subunit
MMNIPFVEKYRPSNMYDIVLDTETKTIMDNIIQTQHFPNLLLYGPPGTGKTTTIINLIKTYKDMKNETMTDSIIHLNSSDDRGVDIIRYQIQTFISSDNLFSKNAMKFIVLDEVDYMTKQAQNALKCLIQQYSPNIRYCLMCNYIYKIEEALKTEFVLLRYNNLPPSNIISFLDDVNIKENLGLSSENLRLIQEKYGSDIRSMLNQMQLTGQTNDGEDDIIFDENREFEIIFTNMAQKRIKLCAQKFNEITIKFNKDNQSLWKQYFMFLLVVKNTNIMVTSPLLKTMEKIISSSNEEYTPVITEYYFSIIIQYIIK